MKQHSRKVGYNHIHKELSTRQDKRAAGQTNNKTEMEKKSMRTYRFLEEIVVSLLGGVGETNTL